MGSYQALFLLSLVWTTTYSKSLSSNSDNFRKSRQLDFGECCPCPKPQDVKSDQLIYQAEMASADDCPCRNRESDAEGASSMLSPTLQALRPFIRSDVTNTEPEPLLKPEVGLASSVLETLQEVTNEEYQDALARDAARSVVKALETDLPLMQPIDAPGNIINIILNPKEAGSDLEVVPEASHIEETRCIHSPLERSSNFDTKNLKSSLFLEPRKCLQSLKESKSRSNYFDMDNEASNIQNSLQQASNGYVMKSINQKPYQNESTEKLQNENSFLTNIVRGKSLNSDSNAGASNRFTKVPDLKLSTIVDNIKKSLQSNPILNQFTKKNINTDAREKNTPISTNSPKEEPVLPQKLTSTLKPLIFNNIEKPMKLRNLLKLKDVELIPIQYTNKNDKINHIDTKERSLVDNDNVLNASVTEDDKIRDYKGHLENAILDAVPSSSNTNMTTTKLQSSNLLTLPNRLNNRIDTDVFKKVLSDISTTSESNLIETSIINKHDKLIDRKNNPVTNINSIKAESDDQSSESSDLQTHFKKENDITLEETDPCTVKMSLTGVQNEFNFNKNSSSRKKPDKNTLPLISEDIIESFENFKKVNDDMQEKLKQNMQNVLPVVDEDNKKIAEDDCVKYKYNDPYLNSNEISNKEKSLSVSDLQKMSDSILNISNMKENDLISSGTNKQLTKEIKPVDCIVSKNDAQEFDIENDSDERFSKENIPINSLERSTNEQNTLLDKRNEISSNSLAQTDPLCNDSENLNILNSNKNSNNDNSEVEIDTEDLKTGIPINSLGNATNPQNTLLDKRHEIFTNSLTQIDHLSNYSENFNTLNSNQNNNNQVEMNTNDLKTEMSEKNVGIKTKLSLSNPNNSYVAKSNNESGCVERNSNEMSVQASEPIANRAAFVHPNLNQQASDRHFKSKYSLNSAFKPYSAKVISPNSLDRDLLRHNLVNKKISIQDDNNKDNIRNNLQNVNNKVDKGILSRLERNKHKDILISEPLHGLESISDDLNLRTAESLKTLKNVLGVGKNKNRIKSNDLFQDVLSNAEDFRKSFYDAHNDLNDKLQELHMDWNNKIHSISERADNVDRSMFNKATNARTNSVINSKTKPPMLSLDKKRAETKLIQGIPKTFTNALNQEKSNHLLHSSRPLNEKLFSVSKGKSTISTFTTTIRPILTFSTKKPQKKGVVLNSTPKPILSQAIKNALESVSANKLNMKLKDLRPLSSNIDSVTIKNQHVIPRSSRSESHETNEIEHTSSLENIKSILPNRDLNLGSSRRHNFASNINTPFQLKAEEFSLLSRLIEGIRSRQSKSDTIRNTEDNYVNVKEENLQSPSQNIEQIEMPENTLKENISYKCKMVCSKDDI